MSAPGSAIASVVAEDADVAETIPVATSVVRLDPGLYAVEIVTTSAPSLSGEPTPLPVWLAQVPAGPNGSLDMLSAGGSGDQWLTGTDRMVAIRAPSGGALLTATMFGSPDHPPSPPDVIVRPLDRSVPAIEVGHNLQPAATIVSQPTVPAAQPVVPPLIEGRAMPVAREIRLEVAVHIERLGDRTFAGSTWAGTPGEQKRLEGFSIRPLQELQPNEIEYKALHPGGIETPWIPGPQFCGTRGKSLPITGFAIRIAPHVQDQFSVIYQAAFFRSGISEPRGNGAPCLPRIAGDALEGINIRIVQGRAG